MNKNLLQFPKFLNEVASTSFEQNTTATGAITIQQTTRNELRKAGVAALKADLELVYGDQFDVVETKEGIVIVVENEPDGFTFSWEIKNTIKSLDYDPFIEADRWEDEKETKAAAKEAREQAKEAKAKALAEKRAAKLASLSQE